MSRTVGHVLIFFSGRVQGVGFRYLTRQVATGYEVCGTVENLADGRVRLEMEGDERELKAMLKALERETEGLVREKEEHWGQREPRLRGFLIRRGSR